MPTRAPVEFVSPRAGRTEERRHTMVILTARYVTAAAFLTAFEEAPPPGSLWVPSTCILPPGAAVVVELVGRLLPEHVMLRGHAVTQRPAVPRQCVRAAVQVAFPAAERAAVDFVVGVVRGAIRAQRRRQTPRLPLSLAVTYRRAGHPESSPAEVVDLSVGGLALLAPELLPVDADLVVQLPLPGGLGPLELQGTVVTREQPGRLVGVKFQRRGDGGVRRLREAIRRLRAA